MKKIVNILILLVFTLSLCSGLFGCATKSSALNGTPSGYDDMGARDDYMKSEEIASPGSADGFAETGEVDIKPSTDEPSSAPDYTNVKIKPGQLTAGCYNDNERYDDWLKLFLRGQKKKDDGKFVRFSEGYFELNSQYRVKVTGKKEDKPVEFALVTCVNGDNVLFSAMTDATGTAYLFPKEKSGDVVISSISNGEFETKTLPFDEENRDIVFNLSGNPAEKNKLIQLMFVVDATGSMGDEMSYLVAELGDVIKRIVQNNANDIKIHLSFIFYRDDGDDEKFFNIDFTDVTDEKNYEKMQKILENQRAQGGGDYPEALDEALLMAVNNQWSSSATKIIFNLLDAPCHEGRKNINNYSTAVKTAAAKGIRICPIMASGADKLTEYLVRQAAIYTGGTFCYLTDDSGIGGSHYDPDLPNVVIEYLNDMLVRLVDGYYTGEFAQPVYWKDKQIQENQ